jgi:pyrroloquinoline-quinone synthase
MNQQKNNLLEKLSQSIADRHLLKHPFYQAWMNGQLSLEQLKNYAIQYYPHVEAFPRFVSATHSLCADNAGRKVLFMNLSEEEGGGTELNHPELWLRFAEGVGASRSDVKNGAIGEKAQALVDLYFQASRSSYAEGLGVLIAYESQIPEIAGAKIDGLKRHYGIESKDATAFFQVHETADRFHSESCAALLAALPQDEQKTAMSAARKAAEALWDFLTEVYESPVRKSA